MVTAIGYCYDNNCVVNQEGNDQMLTRHVKTQIQLNDNYFQGSQCHRIDKFNAENVSRNGIVLE